MSLVATIDGTELSWQDFRENVLQPFKIHCTDNGRLDAIPTTLVQRLQSFQNYSTRYDGQREAWKSDLDSQRGFNASSAVFPPNLLPQTRSRSIIQRRMLPRLSREGLPLRVPGTRCSLYELPSPKPMMATGFNTENFNDCEQKHLTGALSASGTFIDFDKGEVAPGKTLSCPFMVFEKLPSKSDTDIEAARNRCAIAGTLCLRGQQQLYHKAFGSEALLQDLITFSCAVNNDCAILNCHFADDSGSYSCTPVCKFDLRKDDHFNSFQAWVEGIESWACLQLLPKMRAALAQVVKSLITPPATPPSATLSIDTNSDNVPLVMKELRQVWPLIPWRQETGETPINSSMAQCGTPAFSRLARLQALASPAFRIDLNQPVPLMRLQTDIGGPRVPLDIRRLSALSPQKNLNLDTPPDSPCRPPSLSPVDADPDMPMTARSPILVLTKRLDIALDEIQELRGQVEHLHARLLDNDKNLEARVAKILGTTTSIVCNSFRGQPSPMHLSLYQRRRDSKLDEGYHTNDDDIRYEGIKNDHGRVESPWGPEGCFFPPVMPGYFHPWMDDNQAHDFQALAQSTLGILIYLWYHDVGRFILVTLIASILSWLTGAGGGVFVINTLMTTVRPTTINEGVKWFMAQDWSFIDDDAGSTCTSIDDE